MSQLSEHSNTETKSTAELPPLLQEPDAYTEQDEDDPARLFLKRRRSTLKGLLPEQPDSRNVSESFAEVVETVLPQHANTLQVTKRN